MAKSKRPSIPPTPGGILTNEQWAGLFEAVEREVAADPAHPLLVGHPEGNPVQIRPPWRPQADRWVQGVQSVGAQRWEQGIQNPRADFKAAALANNDGWKAGVNAAVAGDRYAKGVQTVNVDEAIATAVAIGGAGYSAGAAARSAKFQRKVDAIAPRMAAVVEATRRMPARTDQEREARMLNQVRGAREAAKGPAGR